MAVTETAEQVAAEDKFSSCERWDLEPASRAWKARPGDPLNMDTELGAQVIVLPIDRC